MSLVETLIELATLLPERLKVSLDVTAGWGLIEVYHAQKWRVVDEIRPAGISYPPLEWQFAFALEAVLRKEIEARGWWWNCLYCHTSPLEQRAWAEVRSVETTWGFSIEREEAFGPTPVEALASALLLVLRGQG